MYVKRKEVDSISDDEGGVQEVVEESKNDLDDIDVEIVNSDKHNLKRKRQNKNNRLDKYADGLESPESMESKPKSNKKRDKEAGPEARKAHNSNSIKNFNAYISRKKIA
jgi:hypothetical protein